MSDKQTPENAVDYKATLNLPHTEFAMKANLAVREAKWLEEWYADNIISIRQASEATVDVGQRSHANATDVADLAMDLRRLADEFWRRCQ